MREMFRPLFSLALVGAHGLCFPQMPDPPADKEKDMYDIYSLLLDHPKTSHGPGNDPRILIAGTTVPGVPSDPCISPPKERGAEFEEVLADFRAHGATQRKLRPAFSLAKPYFLLSPEEVAAFEKDHMAPRPPGVARNPQFEGVADLFRLSEVYFNHRRTLALTAVATWCGGLCGLMRWVALEKQKDGSWQELPWIGCSTIAVIPSPAASFPGS
jgi:hypothetical protein